uniref:ATP synthase F0 subunit 8 n=1 Tax=Lynceus grossipedia TaxID=2774322 RepID=UPI0023AAE29C|nr:ATP synthase F0 subunit 8 [Lynceus grossipedia]WCD23721.1 ATP synthase F0 subunit 8 [Lynceus grossipedia]
MPQMAPMNWILIFLMFSSLIFFCMVIVYFLKNKFLLNNNPSMMKNHKILNWKW